MFVKDLPKDFYSVIHGKQCLLLVNFDVDAICASKILQTLFKTDNVVYTLVPVQGACDLLKAYQENAAEVEYVIMINCGGTINIIDFCEVEPEKRVVFFVLDSHRPYNLGNIYNGKQVRILGEPNVEEVIPEYNDVFRDDSSDEEDGGDEDDKSDHENESVQAKKIRLHETRILRRKKKRAWERKKLDTLSNYEEYSYYGKSSAVIAFELTWQISRDNLHMLWWAIVGSTEQFIMGKVDSSTSVLESGNLQDHVSRLSRMRSCDGDKQQLSAIKISFDKDLQLALYHHWTVEDSLRHSIPSAVALRLWSMKGEQRLRELLAEMGLPLAQSKQRFSSMDLNLKKEFRTMMETLAEKYKISSVIGSSFTVQYGYKFKFSASDVVYAMLATLESTSRDRSPKLCFFEASDCLTRTQKDILDKGIERAKCMLIHIYKTAQTMLEMKQITNAGTFYYIVITEASMNNLFSHPHALVLLAQLILRARVESSRNQKLKASPLVASANLSIDSDTCLIVGVPPVSAEQPK
ncbi:hypothetical protein QAD02_013964, partial [Eretmocerus hayati]